MADVYKIGVAITLTNNVSQVLGVIARDMLGLNVKAKQLQGTFDRIKLAALGAAGVLAGGAALRGLGHLVEHGQKLVHQQSLLLQAGVSQQDVAFATSEAYKTMNSTLGTGVVENLELLADLRNRLGDLHHAAEALPEMAKIGVVMSAGTGMSAAKAGDDFARFLELRGALVNPVTEQIDPERLKAQARLGEAIAVSTRFKVGPDQLLAFQQQARASGAGLSDQGLINMVPYIQAGGGTRVGTQLSSLMQQTIGGVMTKAGAEFFERAGILDANKVHVGRGGHLSIDDHAWKDEGTLRSDAATWINTTLREGLKSMGASTVDDQTTAIMRSHLRATVVGLLVEGIRSAPAFAKDADLVRTAMGTDQYQVGQQTDTTTKMKAFREAWDNLLTALGAPMVETAYNLLGVVTRKLTDLAIWAANHQGMVQVIEGVAAGLAALAVGAGALAIGSAAASALGVLTGPIGLAALAVGISAVFAALPADARAAMSARLAELVPTAAQVAEVFKTMAPRVVLALADAVLVVGDAIGHAARVVFDAAVVKVAAGLSGVSDAIIAWVAGLPARIGGALAGVVTGVVAGVAPRALTEDQQRRLNPMGAAPSDGFGVDGRPTFQRQSYVPPASGGAPIIHINNVTTLDGEVVARSVTKRQARDLNRPPYGVTGFDGRMSPIFGGASYAT